ncbi:glycosyltransferase [Rhizobium rhizogenes]|jgi:glycosyltransferase involved in cell wall biosynthesis|uniref:glycosyltransferase n=1 Tax=Rhizobium rhizogenes TaxID=359 RepID=UPI000689A32A|nr:glycosyltransferase [Rhizobium rhizogenes]
MDDKELLINSPLFNSSFYREQYRDVDMVGMHPIDHYLWIGARMGRDPSPEFSTAAYLQNHHDIARQSINPLVHYLRYGKEEGRLVEYSQHYTSALASLTADAEADQSVKVSVIMPAYNRKSTIGRSIQSVLDQTYTNFELIVVDDGSTDNTVAVIQSFTDTRIKLTNGQHAGVSAARNLGLARATGSIIAYLDSDNVWLPSYLGTMVGYIAKTGADVAYSQIEIVNDADRQIRGQPFDREQCLKGNFVDLNVYCHHRDLYDRYGGFDESLRRMVDWDLILRQTERAKLVGYVPFVGCVYTNTVLDQNRISVKEFRAFKKVVIAKATNGSRSSSVTDHVKLTFAIKVPAPYEKRHEWGDFHYADSLAGSLNRLGHKVRIDFYGQWERKNPAEDDVVIIIRGLTSYEPILGHINILWNISHPDQISFEEYESFDLCYVASLSYSEFLSATTKAKVKPLLQATDTNRFNPGRRPPKSSAKVLFVGNSRNEYREIVRWAVDAKLDLSVYGTRWEQFIPKTYLKGTNIPNKELGGHYHSAVFVLNDHWPSMRDFGFISNRIFDVLAAGGNVISDRIPAISYVFGESVTQIKSQDELVEATNVEGRTQRPSISREVSRAHSFDQRAKTILGDIFNLLGLPQSHDRPSSPFILRNKRLVVNGVVRQDREFPQSSAFIRLLCPLTTDEAYGEIDFNLVPAKAASHSRNADITIVQRTAYDTMEDASAFLDLCKTTNSKLIVDNDDAFCFIDESHPEFDLYKSRIAGLNLLLENANANWVSTNVLRAAYSNLSKRPIVVQNAIDPRLWRNYRKPKYNPQGIPRLVYAGSATHDDDFEMILGALDSVSQTYRFKLTIIGAVRNPPTRDWIEILPPPRTAQSYPRFVRWFREQGPFDIGLAPLKDTPFNAAKSDLKLLDYGALGIFPVASKGPSYTETLNRLGSGALVENTTDAWTATLTELLADLDIIADKRAVAENYCFENRNVSKAYAEMRELLLNLQ